MRTVLIEAGAVLTEPGKPPLSEQTIVIQGSKVQAVVPGFAYAAAHPDAYVVDLRHAFVMPGLIDVHVHLCCSLLVDQVVQDAAPPQRRVLDAAARAREILLAGVTSVRDAGDNSEVTFALRDAIARGEIPGPRIVAAGRFVSRTEGHSAERFLPGDIHRRQDDPASCDGIESCRHVVRENVGRGSDFIKITVSGSAGDEWGTAGALSTSTPEEVNAMVAAAHALGRRVAAHAHSTDSINVALRAGVDTIEHGTYFNSESVRLFKEKGAYIVPTQWIANWFLTDPTIRRKVPASAWPTLQAIGRDEAATAGRAWRAGLKLAVGTDSGSGAPPDATAQEIGYFVQQGIPAGEALRDCITNGATIIGASTRVGLIRQGYDADIIATPESPLQDPASLRRVSFVMRGGTIYKSPAMTAAAP